MSVPFRSIHAVAEVRDMRIPAAGVVRAGQNESPFEPIAAVEAAIIASIPSLNRYPSSSQLLEGPLAAYYGVEPGSVLVGPGSLSMLHMLASAVCDPGDELLFGWRSFDAYVTVARTAGARAVTVPTTADGSLDLVAMAAAVTPATRLVFLCTPNNPSGMTVSTAEFRTFMAAIPRDVLVILDEAYAEFCVDPDAVRGLDELAALPNLAVLKTFSKSFGLAGIRLGYLIAAPEIIDGVRRLELGHGISGATVAAGLASLDPSVQEELAGRVSLLVSERVRVRAALLAQGYGVGDSQANFLLLDIGEPFTAFTDFVEERGIGVRPYGVDGVRFTILTPDLNDRFLAITAEWADASASATPTPIVTNSEALAG